MTSIKQMVTILYFTWIQVFCCRRWLPPWYCYSWRRLEWSTPHGLSRCWKRFWTYWTPTTSWPRGWTGMTRRISPGQGSGVSRRGHVKWEGSCKVGGVVYSQCWSFLFQWNVIWLRNEKCEILSFTSIFLIFIYFFHNIPKKFGFYKKTKQNIFINMNFCCELYIWPFYLNNWVIFFNNRVIFSWLKSFFFSFFYKCTHFTSK